MSRKLIVAPTRDEARYAAQCLQLGAQDWAYFQSQKTLDHLKPEMVFITRRAWVINDARVQVVLERGISYELVST